MIGCNVQSVRRLFHKPVCARAKVSSRGGVYLVTSEEAESRGADSGTSCGVSGRELEPTDEDTSG
jgi:hypothetical protein